MTEPTPSSVGERKRRRRVFDTLNEGVVVQDTDGIVRDWNAPALRMFGLTPEQLCSRAPLDTRWHVTWEDRTPVSTDQPMQTVLRRAFERGAVTVAVRKPDGASAWIAISSQLVGADEDSAEATIVSTMTDVTAQRDMALENARYRDIIDTLDASYRILEESPIGMCSVDADGNVLRNNMAFLALGGGETTSIMPLVPRRGPRDAARRVRAPARRPHGVGAHRDAHPPPGRHRDVVRAHRRRDAPRLARRGDPAARQRRDRAPPPRGAAAPARRARSAHRAAQPAQLRARAARAAGRDAAPRRAARARRGR